MGVVIEERIIYSMGEVLLPRFCHLLLFLPISLLLLPISLLPLLLLPISLCLLLLFLRINRMTWCSAAPQLSRITEKNGAGSARTSEIGGFGRAPSCLLWRTTYRPQRDVISAHPKPANRTTRLHCTRVFRQETTCSSEIPSFFIFTAFIALGIGMGQGI